MRKKTIFQGGIDLPLRTFTFHQLSKISDDNHGVLNRCIDLSAFNKDDVFVLYPRMIHHHGYGLPVDPHLRTLVTKINKTKPLAYQDVTFAQWEQGKVIHSIAS